MGELEAYWQLPDEEIRVNQRASSWTKLPPKTSEVKVSKNKSKKKSKTIFHFIFWSLQLFFFDLFS